MKSKRVCLVIDDETRRLLDRMAKANGLSASAQVRLLIRQAAKHKS